MDNQDPAAATAPGPEAPAAPSAWKARWMVLRALPRLASEHGFAHAGRVARQLLVDAWRDSVPPAAAAVLSAMWATVWRLAAFAAVVVGAWQLLQAAQGGSYASAWGACALIVLGFTFASHVLGYMLRGRRRRLFRPLTALPARLVLLAALYVPVLWGLRDDASWRWAGATVAIYLLSAPWLSQWTRLWVDQMLHPRRIENLEDAPAATTEDCLRRMHIHEAGHATLFGLGDSVPEDLFAYVDPQAGEIVGGAVLAASDYSLGATAPEALRFRMLTLMAGAAAEREWFGQHSVGCLSDVEDFEVVARAYLAIAGSGYFMDPVGEREVAFNAKAIAALRDEYLELAAQHLRLNRDVVEAVAQLLVERKELTHEDLAPALAKVRALPGSPRPRWGEAVRTVPLPRSAEGELEAHWAS